MEKKIAYVPVPVTESGDELKRTSRPRVSRKANKADIKRVASEYIERIGRGVSKLTILEISSLTKNVRVGGGKCIDPKRPAEIIKFLLDLSVSKDLKNVEPRLMTFAKIIARHVDLKKINEASTGTLSDTVTGPFVARVQRFLNEGSRPYEELETQIWQPKDTTGEEIAFKEVTTKVWALTEEFSAKDQDEIDAWTFLSFICCGVSVAGATTVTVEGKFGNKGFTFQSKLTVTTDALTTMSLLPATSTGGVFFMDTVYYGSTTSVHPSVANTKSYAISCAATKTTNAVWAWLADNKEKTFPKGKIPFTEEASVLINGAAKKRASFREAVNAACDAASGVYKKDKPDTAGDASKKFWEVLATKCLALVGEAAKKK